MGSDWVDAANELRKDIKAIAAKAKMLKDQTVRRLGTPVGDTEDVVEMIANLTLSYRHLEDASMRVGKALQAQDGGVSVYDRDTTVGA